MTAIRRLFHAMPNTTNAINKTVSINYLTPSNKFSNTFLLAHSFCNVRNAKDAGVTCIAASRAPHQFE
jgi:hypothetical protein